MCGIIGYVGGRNARDIVLEGLKLLEYRGYDSAGIALVEDSLAVYKTAGRVRELNMLPKSDAHTAIGHTRWATHGRPTAANAHPHLSFDGKIAVVHNGVIENFAVLREELAAKGITLLSDTDSEVIAHMLALENCDMTEAVRRVGERLKGAATFLAVKEGEDKIYIRRFGASMAVSVGEGEGFCASDVLALSPHSDRAIVLGDGEYGVLSASGLDLFKDGRRIKKQPILIRCSPPKDCACHMSAELEELPEALQRTYDSFKNFHIPSELAGAKRILLVGCGTAYHACLYGKLVLERETGARCEAVVASEFEPDANEGDLAIFVTQSGETADTLSALHSCKRQGIPTLAITNVAGSSAALEADSSFLLEAGAEIAVAATKSYCCQLLALYLLAKKRAGHAVEQSEISEVKRAAREALDAVAYEERLMNSKLFFIGKGQDYITAREGALKLREITYRQADAYPAGELKHGTIALMDEGAAAIVVATEERAKCRLVATVEELRARGAYTLAVSCVGEIGADKHILLPRMREEALAPIISVLPLQYLALTASLTLGLDPDKPRNLAKSVTVI